MLRQLWAAVWTSCLMLALTFNVSNPKSLHDFVHCCVCACVCISWGHMECVALYRLVSEEFRSTWNDLHGSKQRLELCSHRKVHYVEKLLINWWSVNYHWHFDQWRRNVVTILLMLMFSAAECETGGLVKLCRCPPGFFRDCYLSFEYEFFKNNHLISYMD